MQLPATALPPALLRAFAGCPSHRQLPPLRSETGLQAAATKETQACTHPHRPLLVCVKDELLTIQQPPAEAAQQQRPLAASNCCWRPHKRKLDGGWDLRVVVTGAAEHTHPHARLAGVGVHKHLAAVCRCAHTSSDAMRPSTARQSAAHSSAAHSGELVTPTEAGKDTLTS